jgi:predicted ATPase
VTSREPLRVLVEQEFPVPPLSLATGSDLLSDNVAALLRSGAIELFVARASAVKPDFRLTDGNARAVAEICRRLDGLPLAIELAASRIRILTPEAILDRIGQRFALLTRGARGAPSRQQTLRSAMDWSYDLLTKSEQALFARLAAFVDGCTLDAVEAICRPGDDLGIETLDGVSSLVDKSLVLQRDSSDMRPRFGMLETIREYAHERLRADANEDGTRDRHADFYAGLAKQARPHLATVEGRRWGDLLEQEHGNLRGALDWLMANGRVDAAQGLAYSCWRSWIKHGRLREGAAAVERTLEHSDPGSDLNRAHAQIALGELYRLQGDLGRARRAKEAALETLRHADPGSAAATLGDLGHISERQGMLVEARRLHEEAMALQLRAGDKGGITHAKTGRARLAVGTNDLQLARTLYAEVLKSGRELGDAEFVNEALLGLAEVARRHADHEDARRLYREGVVLATNMRDMASVVDSLAGMVSLAIAEAHPNRAARLLGALDAMCATTGLVPYFPDEREERRGALQRMLTPDEYADALAEGLSMSVEEAIAYALAE